jgi:hypothetical protein
MGHISGNESRTWSIEVAIDREYPHEEQANFSYISIYSNGRGRPLKLKNAKERH